MKKVIMAIILAIIFIGCGEEQIVMNTYSPPYAADKVKEMLTKSKNGDAYLVLDLVDDTKFIVNKHNSKDTKTIAHYLVSDIKQLITETNFISLSRVKNDFEIPLSLDMKIVKYSYVDTGDTIKASLSVEFNIRKNSKLIYTKVYNDSVYKHSDVGRQGFPPKSQILATMVKHITKKFMKDITPLKTQKLVTLKPLPDEVKYAITLALAGDFKGAIKLMRSYKGKKDYKYYYDLAIFYEGLATQENDVTYLAEADKYYTKALQGKGSDDEDVIMGKQQFDQLYSLIKEIAKQKLENLKKMKEGEYELLD
jgi:hypothetical protein